MPIFETIMGFLCTRFFVNSLATYLYIEAHAQNGFLYICMQWYTHSIYEIEMVDVGQAGVYAKVIFLYEFN
jgi:hypothetical protein